ncbi:MAG: hypothetical protein RLZZ301_958 [Bacteroidota bacterium]|jgi:hypothetical protein
MSPFHKTNKSGNRIFLHFFITTVFTFMVGGSWGQTASITITNSSVGGSSILNSNNYDGGAERTWTQSTVSFGGKAITCNLANTPTGSTTCQYIQAQASNGVIYNTSALPGRIVSIQFTGSASVASSCYGGMSRLVNTTAANYTVSGTQIGSAQTNTTYTWTTLPTENYTFFCVKRGSSAQYFNSIVVTYEIISTPSAPTITSITPGNAQLSVAYTAPSSNGGASITNYEYSIDNGTTFTTCSPAVTTSPLVINSGLTNGSSYTVKIRAVNSVGSGAASNAVSGTPVAPNTPTFTTSGTLSAVNTTYGSASATPTSFTASGSSLDGTSVFVTPPSGYEVATTSDFSTTIGTNTSPLSLGTNVSFSNTTIYVRLASTTVVGSYSGNIQVSGGGATTVTIATSSSSVAKKALTITAGNQTVVYGTAPSTVTNNGSYIATGFVNSETSNVISGSVTYTTTYTSTTAAGSTTSITPVTSGLSATNYSFSIVNGTITVIGLVPSAPSVSSVTATSTTQVSVAFTAPSSNGGATISNYEFSTDGGSTWTLRNPSSTSSPLAIAGLSPGTTYSVAIRALNSVGSGTSSSTTNVTTITNPPSITAATGATVDAPFDVTFTEDASWRGAISSITVGGTALAAAAYSTASAGLITFTPSASALLQASGSKAIVVIATGYSNATLTQSIGVGAASKLMMVTQPTAPASNGAVLATQPVVKITDQYGNLTISTASVLAAVGSGTWTLGGTSSVSASSGTATFSGLTATSAAAVTGATISFTSTGLTGVTSLTFNIVAPPAANDLCANATVVAINGTSVSGSTVNASYSTLSSEPFTVYSDVWYKMTTTSSSNVAINTTTSGVDYDIYVFTSCPSSATTYITNGNGNTNSSTNSELLYVGLDATTTYYLRVANTTSSAGSTFILSVLPAPTNLASTNTSCNGFTANWDVVTGASTYNIDISSTALSNLKSENFSGFTTSAGTTDRSSSMNTYTQSTGWTGTQIYENAGEIKLGSGSNLGSIITPSISATTNSGSGLVTFDLRKYGSDNTSVVVSISTDNGTTYSNLATISAPEILTKQFVSFSNASATTKIKIAASTASNSRFYLDNIEVISLLGSYKNLSVSGTSQTVAGLTPNTTYYYRVRATSASSTSGNSTSGTVTTAALPSSPTGTGAAICNSGTASLTASVGANETVDWYSAATGGSALTSGSTSFTTPSISTTTTYYAEARNTNSGCLSSSRTAVIATVNPLSVGGTATASASNNCTGASTTISLSGNTGSIQWQESSDNSSFSAITGSNSATLTLSNLQNSKYYRALVTNGVCAADISSVASIVVNPSGTYIGGATGNWSVANNWCGGVPTNTTAVIFPASVAVDINVDADAASILIPVSSSLTVKTNKNLHVTGTLTNNGTFTIEDAAFFQQGATGTSLTGSGTYNVQQSITGASSGTAANGRFWYMSSPMVSIPRSQFGTYSSTGNRLWNWSETNQNYAEITSNTDVITYGVGYVHRRDNNATLTFSAAGSNGLYGSDLTLSGLTKTTGASSGFHLIANPYTAHLNWQDVYNASTAMSPTYYVRSFNANANDINALDSYNSAGNAGTSNSNNTTNQYIAPMQAFWVQVLPTASTTGTVSMSRSMLSHQNHTLKEAIDFPVFARVNLADGAMIDQALVYMNAQMVSGNDIYDSEKLFVSGKPQLYTKVGAKKLVINGMRNDKKKISVPLYLEIPSSKTYVLKLAEFNIDNGVILLEDKQEGTIQDFTLNDQYSFYASSGVLSNRFVIHFLLPDATISAQGPSNSWVAEDDATQEGGSILVSSNGRGKVAIAQDIDAEENGLVVIRDAAGRTILTSSFSGSTASFELNEPSGIYFVEVQVKGQIEIQKIFVQQ